MKFHDGLLSGWVYVGTTGTFAVSVRETWLTLEPVGFLTRPMAVRLQVDEPETDWLNVPHHSTVPASYVCVVCVTEPFDCSPSKYLLSALFSGLERMAIISLMPAS